MTTSANLDDSDILFVKLASERGYVNPDQIQECLRLQAQMAEAGASPVPHLGEILVKRGFISAAEFEQTVRLTQITRATRRMNLTESPSEIPAEAAAGEKLGKYLKATKLGAGGMGEVWKAWDTELRRWVALKFLKGTDPDEIARFRREAQTAAKLSHPNIGAVYEARDEFIAMQFVDGQTLESYRRDDPRALADIMRQAALAVHFAHEHGVIHRDIKPANIMVSNGHAYVMDFGLARSTNLDSRISASGTILGTPAFMSPEQARGSDALDARSDVYSLGATLYELVANRPPFRDAKPYDLLKKVIEEDPKRLAGDLGTIAMKCLEKDPRRRYATAQDLADDLGRYLEGHAIQAHPPSTLYRLRKYLVRRMSVVAACALAGIVAGSFVVWVWVAAAKKSAAIRDELAEARRYESEKKLMRARDAYKSVLDQDRRNAEAREGFQRMEEELKEATRLLETGRPALDKAFAYLYNPNADYEQLVKLVEAGQGRIEQALQKTPDSALGYFLLSRAWELRGYPDKAEECCRKAIELEPGFGPPHYQLGRLLLTRSYLTRIGISQEERDRKRPEAERLCSEAVGELVGASGKTGMDDAMEIDLAAAFEPYGRGDLEKAAKRAIEGTQKYRTSQGVEEFYWLLGICNLGTKRLESLDKAIRLRPKFALAYFGRALAHEEKGDWDAVRADYDAALKINPRFAEAYDNRSNARGIRGDYDGAIADCNESIKLNARNPAAWLNRGNAREAKGDHDGAIADYNEALKLLPRYVEAYFNRALAWQAKNDFDTAISDYTAAIEIDPKKAVAYFGRGGARQLKGDSEGAIADYSEAIRINPKYSDAYHGRGIARQASGDLDGALKEFDQALRLNPRNPSAYVCRGNAKAVQGDTAGQISDYEEALKVAPRNWPARPQVESVLRRLKQK